MAHLPKVFIVAAKRTPFGTFGGVLKDFTANELGGMVSKAMLQELNKPIPIDTIVFGNVAQTSTDAAYLARHIGHRAGLPIEVPAVTINRLCGSGFEAVVQGAKDLQLGEAQIALVGGSENMSQAPYALRHVRWGVRYGMDLKAEDTLAAALVDRYPNQVPMGMTAENLAEKYNISREQCDTYALSSQERWAKAHAEGIFTKELMSIPLPKKNVTMTSDEHPRPKTTMEGLSKLPPVFKQGGTVTAGNASGISDGAAALLLAAEPALKKHGLTPLARVVAWCAVGVDPSIMGIGPVPAIRRVLEKTQLTLADMDRIEVNEAFAAQYLAVEKELQLDRKKTNVHGGAIALGHPLAASGARILTHLTYDLRRIQGRYGLGAACIGGGQGIAVILERV